ncbi:hypothetical protein EV363DRAFT_1209346, partial [Boletus edulis]
MSTTGTLPFTVNERVLCYHGPLIYEAKVMKTEMWDETNTKLAGVGPHFFDIYYANNYLRSRQVVSIPQHSLLHCRDICSTNSTKQARQLIATFSREF